MPARQPPGLLEEWHESRMSAQSEPGSKTGLPPHGQMVRRLDAGRGPPRCPRLMLRRHHVLGKYVLGRRGAALSHLMCVALKSNRGRLLLAFLRPRSALRFLKPEVIQHPAWDTAHALPGQVGPTRLLDGLWLRARPSWECPPRPSAAVFTSSCSTRIPPRRWPGEPRLCWAFRKLPPKGVASC